MFFANRRKQNYRTSHVYENIYIPIVLISEKDSFDLLGVLKILIGNMISNSFNLRKTQHKFILW